MLPTKNRLEYLKLAIETVRRQSAGDWELAISDNQSGEDVAGYVRSLGDDRILYSRTPGALAVTENWNAVLAMTTGDYVLMLGDDDGVLPGYVVEMTALLERFDGPDLVYTGSRVFTYPGVDPQAPGGRLVSNTYADFLAGGDEPQTVTREQALAAVRRSLDLRLAFNFNMQVFLFSRRLIEAMRARGEVFQSAFPDYYASCAGLLLAERVVADPRELVVIGVTPKSYGFFHINEREDEGRDFLAGQSAPEPQAGTNINAGWLSAMEALEANYGEQFGLRANRGRYHRLQAAYVYTRAFRGSDAPGEVAELEASLRWGRRAAFRLAYRLAKLAVRLMPRRLWMALTARAFRQFPDDATKPRGEGGLETILDVTQAERG
jgi:glycosyltransferase involved in cell wall biosynthesis